MNSERFVFSLEDYKRAIQTCDDEAYRQHLIHDFLVGPEGVMPKVDRSYRRGIDVAYGNNHS